jgi:hypothetical protein
MNVGPITTDVEGFVPVKFVKANGAPATVQTAEVTAPNGEDIYGLWATPEEVTAVNDANGTSYTYGVWAGTHGDVGLGPDLLLDIDADGDMTVGVKHVHVPFTFDSVSATAESGEALPVLVTRPKTQ